MAHTFIQPKREILSPMDMPKWTKSKAYRDYLGFIITLNESVKGRKISDSCEVSTTCQSLVGMLDELESWVDEIPPCEQPQRFGNKAFRDWASRLENNKKQIIDPLLTDEYKAASIELEGYLIDSFGNSTRIDYGTGHEACFLALLCCLYKLKILTETDNIGLVTVVLVRYLKLTRRLQVTYRMEPAGSQGVYGLDDFQFIPYIWGSAQHIGTGGAGVGIDITPQDIPSKEKASSLKDDYLLFAATDYIHTVKNGPFAEHSNVLWGISSVQHWSKVNSGLLKMYKAEVLAKFPVIQHFVFGSLLSIDFAS